MEPTIIIEAWKAGGIVLVLLLSIGILVWLGWKDARSRERRMGAAIDKCHEQQVEATTGTVLAVANNTNAMRENTEATRALCDVLRDRPCLKDATPLKNPIHRTPRPH